MNSNNKQKSNEKVKSNICGLTVHVQNKARFLRLYKFRIGSLTGEYRVEIAPLNLWPQQSIFDNIARVVLILIVHSEAIYKPTDCGLRTSQCERIYIFIIIKRNKHSSNALGKKTFKIAVINSTWRLSKMLICLSHPTPLFYLPCTIMMVLMLLVQHTAKQIDVDGRAKVVDEKDLIAFLCKLNSILIAGGNNNEQRTRREENKVKRRLQKSMKKLGMFKLSFQFSSSLFS